MKTSELIRELASDLETDTGRPRPLAGSRLAFAVGLASLVSLSAIAFLLSHSPHFANGPTVTVLITATAAMTLAIGAFWSALRLGVPGTRVGLRWLLLPVAILMSGLGFELVHMPSGVWTTNVVGANPLACFLSIVTLSLPILGAALLILRDGASTDPQRCGAMAGLLAGGITAALYTLHCPENSLLFVGAWHVLAILTVGAVGAVAGGRCLRW
jgi:hypothetical protein